MWWKILISIVYLLIVFAVGRYIYIRRSYFISETFLYDLETAKLITESEHLAEVIFAPIVWPLSLTLYFIFNVVDKTYIKAYEKSRTKSN